MNKVVKIAVATAVAVVLGNSVSALADDAPAPPPKGQVSAAAGKDLQAAQKALQAQKYDEVLADLEKVKNNPKKNDYDDYAMNQFYYSTYVAQKKLKEAEPALEALLDSKYMQPDEKKKFIVAGAYLN